MGDTNTQELGNRFFLSAAPVYGQFSDDGLDRTVFARTFEPTGTTAPELITSQLPRANSGWGYQLSVGYQFGPQNMHDIVLSYLNLTNSGTKTVGVGPTGVLSSPLSVISEISIYGPAIATAKVKYQYQTGDLVTHRYFGSDSLPNVQFSRFYGVKASEIQRSMTAQYSGTTFSGPPEVVTDASNYSAKYYGVGPEIGMGTKWALGRYFTVGGDVFAAILFGANSSNWNETLTDPGFMPTVTNFTEVHNSRTWGSAILGGNLTVGAHMDISNHGRVALDLGVAGEQYVSNVTVDKFAGESGSQSITNAFSIRSAFLRFSYFC